MLHVELGQIELIVALPIHAHRVARSRGHGRRHQVQAIHGEGGVHRNRDRADHGAGAFKMVRRVEHQRVYIFLAVRQPETFLQDADAKSLASAFSSVVYGWRLQCRILAGIETIGTSQSLQHQRAIVHGVRHRPDMIDGHLDRKNASERNQPPGWLYADDAAERGGHTDGAAFIAPHRHVDDVGRNQCRAAARRSAGGARVIVRVEHEAGVAGVAAEAHAEALAHRLAA